MSEADEFGPGGDFVEGPQNEDRTVKHAFSSVHAVIPQLNNPDECFDKITLCRVTGEQAEDGVCPVHHSDACLSLFVRYNYFMEVADREWDKAKLRIRQGA
jgi:hypothetical protein